MDKDMLEGEVRQAKRDARDCLKIARADAGRLFALEDRHELLLARLESLELRVRELARVLQAIFVDHAPDQSLIEDIMLAKKEDGEASHHEQP